MITDRTDRCPECGGIVKYRDKTKRMIRLEYGQREYIKISRFKCVSCGKIHRALPKELTPYKHYKTELIKNMINDVVTTDDAPYEKLSNRFDSTTMEEIILRFRKNKRGLIASFCF